MLVKGESLIHEGQTISNDGEKYSCTCAGFVKSGIECKHIKSFLKPVVVPLWKSTWERTQVNYNELIEAKEDTSFKRFKGVMLAGKYDGSQDIEGWIMSEKLDGVWCVWTGEAMFTWNGNPFYPPAFFIEGLPKDLVLDGELFLERGEFQKTMSIVWWQDENDEWKKIQYLIFDGPELKGNFKNWLKLLKEALDKCDNKYVKLHEHKICKG